MTSRIRPSRAKGRTTPSAREVQVVTPVRAELHKALKVRAAEEGTTLRVLVMRGLRAIGLPVLPVDEEDRRGARGNRRGEAAKGPTSAKRRTS
jgi:hypothetical protein